MKTILINPPSTTYRKPEENLGLSYLKSFLLKNNQNCEIIDGYLKNLSNQEIIDRILFDKDCKVIWFSPYIDSLQSMEEIISCIRGYRKDIIVVLWGHLATFSYEDLLQNDVDYIVRWEGEQTLLELVEAIELWKKELSFINWISYKNSNNEIVTTASRDLIWNLDSLPFPDRTDASYAKWEWALCQISWSRWCFWNCSFCSISSLYKLSNGSAWRGRSVDDIISELKILEESWFKMFKFVDDSFIWPWKKGRDRILNLAKKIISEWLNIRFRISTRADSVDKELFTLLKQAWLYSVSIWIESGHQRALDTFNKWVEIETNQKALNILKDLNIITLMGFIGFDPYTNIDECEQNLSFLKEMDFALVDVISKPLFVHAKDPITSTFLNEWIINGRDFPNYTYDIEDKKAKVLHSLLLDWNNINKDIYYEITDMLTAPRITNITQEKELIKIFKELRSLDMEIYEKLLSMVKWNSSINELNLYLSKYKEAHFDKLNFIKNEFYKLISI